MIELRVILPTAILLEGQVRQVAGDSTAGAFCLLPDHVDWVAALVPGILTLTTAGGGEQFLASDAGLLVKRGRSVRVAVRRAVQAATLEELRPVLERHFRRNDAAERHSRRLLGRLEMGFRRRFMDLGALP